MLLKRAHQCWAQPPLKTSCCNILQLQVGGGQSTVPQNSPKAQLPSPRNYIALQLLSEKLPCHSLKFQEQWEESKEDRVQRKAWSSAKESMVQCSAYHGTWQIRDSPSGWGYSSIPCSSYTLCLWSRQGSELHLHGRQWDLAAVQRRLERSDWTSSLLAQASEDAEHPTFLLFTTQAAKAGAAPWAASSPFVPVAWGSRRKLKRYHHQEQQHPNPHQ